MRRIGFLASLLLVGACSSPPNDAHVQQSSASAADAGKAATPPASDGNPWGRADAAAERDTGAPYDAGTPDASDDPTAYTLGSVQCGAGAACGTSRPVCCVGRDDVCREFTDPCKSTDVAVSCDGPEDCGLGEVCCARSSRVACDPEGASHCPIAPDTSATIVCHTDADCGSGSATPICEREASVALSLLTCHRACASPTDCEGVGMHYCYVAAGARTSQALCHAKPQ